jgi:hypothetical protein
LALPLLLALTLIDVAVGWHGYLPVLPTREAQLPLTDSISALKDRQGTQRTTAGATLGGPQTLVPNTGEYFGLRDPRGRGVPTLTRTTTAWAALGGAAAANFAFVDPSDPAAARALRAFAVRAVLVNDGSRPPSDSRRVHRGTDGDVYALNHTLPRAWITCDWTPTTERDALVALAAASIATLRQRPLI